MRPPYLAAILASLLLAGSGANALAQNLFFTPKAADAEKKAAGAACSTWAPDSQARKDCLKRQGTAGKIAKPVKPKPPAKPGGKS